MFRFLVATDCFVETCLVTDRFGGLIPNSGWWSSRDDQYADRASCLQSFITRQCRFLDAGYLALTSAAAT